MAEQFNAPGLNSSKGGEACPFFSIIIILNLSCSIRHKNKVRKITHCQEIKLLIQSDLQMAIIFNYLIETFKITMIKI